MQDEENVRETYKNKKMKEFKKDLDNLLDRYEFSGWRRDTIEEQCMAAVKTQLAYTDKDSMSRPSQLKLGLKENKKV